MRTIRLVSAGFLAMALAGTGAMIASAQTTPVSPAAPQAQDQGQPPAPGQPPQARQPSPARDGWQGMRDGHGKRHGRGGPGKMMMGEMFARIDSDGDGQVTQAEIDAFRAERVGAADASGDGALTLEEFDSLYRDLTRRQMVRAFQSLDTDGDGTISPAELDARFNRLGQRMNRDGARPAPAER